MIRPDIGGVRADSAVRRQHPGLQRLTADVCLHAAFPERTGSPCHPSITLDMVNASPKLQRYLAARDALHVAEIAHAVGKFPVAATLCHLAVSQMLRGAFVAGRKPKQGSGNGPAGLAEGFLAPCSEEQRAFLMRLGAVAAAWSNDPACAATEATQANSEVWLRDAGRLLESLCP